MTRPVALSSAPVDEMDVVDRADEVDRGDGADELVGAMRRMGDPTLRKRLGAAACETARARFSIETHTRQVEALYETVLVERAGQRRASDSQPRSGVEISSAP